MASCPCWLPAFQNAPRHSSSLVTGVNGVNSGTPAPRLLSTSSSRPPARSQSTSTAANPQHAEAPAEPAALPVAAAPGHGTAGAWLDVPQTETSRRQTGAWVRRQISRQTAADAAASETSPYGHTFSANADDGGASSTRAGDSGDTSEPVPERAVRRRRRTVQQLEPAPETETETAVVVVHENVGPQVHRRRRLGPPSGGAGDPDGGAAEARVAAAVSAASNAAAAAALAAAAAEAAEARRPAPAPSQSPKGNSHLARTEPPSTDDLPGSGTAVTPTGGGEDVSGPEIRPGAPGADSSDQRDSTSAARARVQQIKSDLLRKMRSATRAPSAASMQLILSPLQAANEASGATEALLGQPLPLRGPPRVRSAARDAARGGAGRGDGAARPVRKMDAAGTVTLHPMETQRQSRQRPQMPQLQPEQQSRQHMPERLEERESLRWAREGPAGPAEAAAPSGVDRPEQRLQPRRLKPLAARKTPAAAAAATAAAAGASLLGAVAMTDGGKAEASMRTRDEADAEAEVAAAQARRDRLQRDNEAFVKYLEGVAASADATEKADGGVVADGGASTPGSASDETPQRVQQPPEPEAQAPPPPQQQQQQQQVLQRPHANLLRDLAQMFRSFAQRPQPAAASAAVVAATSSAAAAATFTPPGKDSDELGRGGHGAKRYSGGAATPSADLRVADGKVAEANVAAHSFVGGYGQQHVALAGDNGAVQEAEVPGRPGPTGAALLRLLRPVPKARLPPYTRSVGMRISSRRRPRALRLPVVEPPEAREVVGDVSRLPPPALRAARRRAYFYRQLTPRQEEQQQRPPLEEEQHQLSAEGWAGGPATDRQEEAPSTAATPRPRPYSLSDRTFHFKRRAQYTDTLKRAARKSSLEGRAAKGGAAAAAADAPAANAGQSAAMPDEVEEDPRGDYNPAAEVVNDVYEQIMGVRLPERAMYGRRAEALAALSPTRIREQTRNWIEACGKEYALAFHTREPLLLTVPAATLLLSLEHLSRVFCLPPGECVQLALRNPAFIGLPYEQLQGAVEAVSDALEIGLQEAGKIVIKCPGLAVRQHEFPVARRMELLTALLPVSKDKLRQVVRQRPQLLSKSAQSLAAFMMNVSSGLSLPLFDVALMIAGCPGVTGVSAARLVSRWGELQRCAARVPEWVAQLAAISPPSLGRCLVANEAALARLQEVADRGLTDDPELFNFKKVLTMSASRFDAIAAGAMNRIRRESGTSITVSPAVAAATT